MKGCFWQGGLGFMTMMDTLIEAVHSKHEWHHCVTINIFL